MRKMKLAGLILLLSAAGAVAAAQAPPHELTLRLPPEIMLDKYRAQIELRLQFRQHQSALMFMDDMAALHRENGWPLPDEFHFEYGRTAALAIDREVERRGRIERDVERRFTAAAIGALERYLRTAGSSGENYTEALILLDELELETPWRSR